MRAICKDSTCKCSVDGKKGNWIVKRFDSHHSCNASLKNSRVTYKVLADYFIKERGKSALDMKLGEMTTIVMQKLRVDVSITQYRWPKSKGYKG